MENLTPNQAAAGGAILGGTLAIMGIFLVVWWIIQIIAYWKIFVKAGKPGWHSIIPILNVYDEYDICWQGIYGIISILALGFASVFSNMYQNNNSTVFMLLSLVCAIVALALEIIEAIKLSKAFGKGTGFAIGLILLAPIFMLILGFGSAEYIGKEE